MPIIASCGHEVASTDDLECVITADHCRDGDRAILYADYCPTCAADRKKWREYLPTAIDQRRWYDEGLLPADVAEIVAELPYTHHGPTVHGSKLVDYLVSETMMQDAGLLPRDKL